MCIFWLNLSPLKNTVNFRRRIIDELNLEMSENMTKRKSNNYTTNIFVSDKFGQDTILSPEKYLKV